MAAGATVINDSWAFPEFSGETDMGLVLSITPACRSRCRGDGGYVVTGRRPRPM